MTLIHRTIRTSGPDIRLTETNGRGLPIVLLHGSGSSRGVFAEQMNSEMGERHRLIAMDLPGHGESGDASNPELTYSLPGLARTVGEVLRQMEISRAVFFGWSLGGHVGLELMSADPVVAGIMLSGTPPIGHGPLAVLRSFRITFDSMLASKDHFSDSEALRFARACFGDDIRHEDMSSIRRADGRLRKIMFGSMMRGACADEKRLVETSPIPVAMVNGSDDPFFSMNYVARIRYAALWDGMCHVIPDAGHSAFRQMPELFNPLLMRFADDVAMHRTMPRAPKVVAEDAPRLMVSEQVRLRA
jgi:pimeloyl-ACP methyl ester carboxylesterase